MHRVVDCGHWILFFSLRGGRGGGISLGGRGGKGGLGGKVEKGGRGKGGGARMEGSA